VRSIKTQTEFESAISAEKAIIFITFDWSGQAKLSEYVVAEWRRTWNLSHRDLHIPFFKLEPDELSFTHEWVRDTVKERGGYGALVWIKDGAIADYEPNVTYAGIRDIVRRTETIFRN
jgi:hypothetical protein